MTVAQILAVKGRDVTTIAADRTLADVARRLAEKRIGAVVVVDPDGHVEGIVSERDIVYAIATSGAAALDHTVHEHMTKTVETTSPTATLDNLMERMTSGRFRHVPVIEGGRLAGLVSIGDVVKWRVESIESEQRALKDYIASA